MPLTYPQHGHQIVPPWILMRMEVASKRGHPSLYCCHACKVDLNLTLQASWQKGAVIFLVAGGLSCLIMEQYPR